MEHWHKSAAGLKSCLAPQETAKRGFREGSCLVMCNFPSDEARRGDLSHRRKATVQRWDCLSARVLALRQLTNGHGCLISPLSVIPVSRGSVEY